jgi:hypothetical protein
MDERTWYRVSYGRVWHARVDCGYLKKAAPHGFGLEAAFSDPPESAPRCSVCALRTRAPWRRRAGLEGIRPRP